MSRVASGFRSLGGLRWGRMRASVAVSRLMWAPVMLTLKAGVEVRNPTSRSAALSTGLCDVRSRRNRCVRAAAKALLVKVKVLVVDARRCPAPRSHRAPVPPLEDGAVTFALHGARPFVDVARRVVDAEGALACRPCARRLALPDVVDLGKGQRAVAIREETLVEELP